MGGEEEPRYLRRQRPVAIKRRKFGRSTWRGYLHVVFLAASGFAAVALLALVAYFLLYSSRFLLLHPSQISITGNQYVSSSTVLEIFSADRGHSILRIPLAERRHQIEQLPWVQQAIVRRTLPNRVSVEIHERVPVAWVRQGVNLWLIDANGVLLERPLQGDFRFPVVTGMSADTPQAGRAQRIHLLLDFLQQIDLARSGSSDRVSEVDLSDAADVRATFARLSDLDPASAADPSQGGPVVVEFGDRDFQDKFRMLLDNLEQWRATVGRIESVDMRFGREAVVNPQAPPAAAPATAAATSAQNP